MSLDPAALDGFLSGVSADPGIELHSLIIRQHDRVLAEGWWEPYRRDDVHLLYSLSKSFTSTAAGFAVAEGLLDLDRPAHSYLPGAEHLLVDERAAAITVRDAIRMATGHREDTLERLMTTARRADPPIDPALAFFTVPPDEQPGSIFCYNNGATYLVAVIVQRLAGEPLSSYLTPRLFEPLGIPTPYWQTDGLGREIGFSGLHLPTGAISAFGQLYLDDGRLGDRQLLPEGWAELATTKHTANPDEPEIDWRQGYGYQFWRGQHGYRGDGAYGQFCLVLPDQDATIAITSDTERMQSVLDLVYAHLLPALSATATADPESAGTVEPLALTLPPVGGSATGSGEVEWTPTDPTTDPTNDLTTDLTTDRSAPISITELTADTLVLSHPDRSGERSYRIPFATDGWARAELALPEGRLVLGASGGWVTPTRFEAAVAMLNTPHRLDVIGTVTDGHGSSTVTWRRPPLGPTHPWMLALPDA